MGWAIVMAFGVPAVIGMAAGYFLFGKSTNASGKTPFGTDAVDDVPAAIVGALIGGFGFLLLSSWVS